MNLCVQFNSKQKLVWEIREKIRIKRAEKLTSYEKKKKYEINESFHFTAKKK